MFFIVKGQEQAAVRDEDSCRALSYALSDYNCNDSVSRKQVIGSEPLSENYAVEFDEKRIVTISQVDALKVADWMLTLGVIKVQITREDYD